MRFTLGEVGRIRLARRHGATFDNILRAFGEVHTRDELVEAWDATIRCERDGEALELVNYILECQDSRIPLINGRPAVNAAYRAPMF